MPGKLSKTHVTVATLIACVMTASSIAIAYGADKNRLITVEKAIHDHEQRIRTIERIVHTVHQIHEDVQLIKEHIIND